MVGAKHESFAEARSHQCAHITVELGSWETPAQSPEICVDLRVYRHQRKSFFKIGPCCVHEVDAQFRMPIQHLLDQFGISQLRAKSPAAGIIRGACWSHSGMKCYRDVEFFGEREVRLVRGITQA